MLSMLHLPPPFVVMKLSVLSTLHLAPPSFVLSVLSTLRGGDFDHLVDEAVAGANDVFRSFLNSEEGLGFRGQVSIVADSNGGLLAYEALLRGCDFIGNIWLLSLVPNS